MDDFSFVFSLVGLLMGVALDDVIGGTGSALKRRHEIRIGCVRTDRQSRRARTGRSAVPAA